MNSTQVRERQDAQRGRPMSPRGVGVAHRALSLGPAAAKVCDLGDLGFHHRSTAQRRSPIIVHGRLLELRRRARPRLPSTGTRPAQYLSPHDVSIYIVQRRPHNPRRQRLEPLVVPPLRLGHLGALLPCHPPASAPWPRGTAARPPRRAPSWRALHRGRGTPRAGRASGRWPRGRPWQLCVCPAESRTVRPQPAARRTRRPTARRCGLPSLRPRAAAAAPPRHPPTYSAASLPPC
eukprot:scaffold27899_cov66-Phaeocystis_antarctica.AAC.3